MHIRVDISALVGIGFKTGIFRRLRFGNSQDECGDIVLSVTSRLASIGGLIPTEGR